MSSHVDTIRRGLSEYDSEIDSVREQHEALDALLAEIEEWRVLGARQLEEFTVTTQKYRAENQRLREALDKGRAFIATTSYYRQRKESQPEFEAFAFAVLELREALAGDAE